MTTDPNRIAALRAELKARNLDGFVIPLTDEHMSEYVGDYAQRLAWISGFGGSAGNAAVMTSGPAAIFVDGRYTIQVRDEVDGAVFEHHHFQDYPLIKWLTEHSETGFRIGFDPELATRKWVVDTMRALEGKNALLVPQDTNPVDAVWHDQPGQPMSPVTIQPDRFAGQGAAEKRAGIARHLADQKLDATVVAMLDNVAWALNIRGKDVKNTPVPHAYAVFHVDETCQLFVEAGKLGDEVRTHLGNSVEILPRSDFYRVLESMAGKRVLVDPATCNARIFKALEDGGAMIHEGQDPCILPKAAKNKAELAGSRAAHVRDGAAVSEFLHWFSVEAPRETQSELSAARKLWDFRKRREMLHDTSFDTISGAGPNGAIVHYRVNESTNRPIRRGDVYLVDSGGQYLDGTTDITRTVAVGEVGAEARERFTLVLKGHIALATIKFPKGTPGSALDAVARRPLWLAGLDYDHGTGHGVGSNLAVHEGPQRIAKGSSDVPLMEGMILSNEPGYYKTGEYGIRIENLVIVQPEPGMDADGRSMYGFETITLAPIDRTMIVTDMLDAGEKAWLNAYHARVLETIGPLVDPGTKAWLEASCAPL